VWDALTGEPVTPSLQHEEGVSSVGFSPNGRQVVTADGNALARGTGQVRIWDLSADWRPVEDLSLLAQVLTGHRLDATAGLTAIEPTALQRAWQALHARYPEELVTPGDQMRAWHDHEARNAERPGRWMDVIAHLNRLLELATSDGVRAPFGYYQRRANAYAEQDEWERAIIDLRESIDLEAGDPQLWEALALAQLAIGDTDGYRSTCATMVDRFGSTESLSVAQVVARTGAFSAASGVDPVRLVHLAGKATEGSPSSVAPNLSTLGLTLYRAGRYEDVIRRLTSGQTNSLYFGIGLDGLLLAMSHYQLGHVDEARHSLDKALRWIDQYVLPAPRGDASWIRRWQHQLLRREAEALIRPDGR
jgi:tetratricopeptide (TPR) repeat protein